MQRGNVRIRVDQNDQVTGVGIHLDEIRVVNIKPDGTLLEPTAPGAALVSTLGHNLEESMSQDILRVCFQVGKAFLRASQQGKSVRVSIDLVSVPPSEEEPDDQT